MKKYEPGTVAKVTITPDGDKPNTYLAFYSGFDDEWVSARAGRVYVKDSPHTVDIRPIALPDPATHKVVPKDAVVLGREAIGDWDYDPAELRAYADLLEEDSRYAGADLLRNIAEQITPPRIDEPVKWASVVEAGASGRDERFEWSLGINDWWFPNALGVSRRRWEQLLDPVLIRDGV